MRKFTNNTQKGHGFTIVELLVVIVVIGILAAITIVSYTGITARANASKTVANAQTVQSVAEAINADNGKYPVTTAEFGSLTSTARIPGGITIQTGAPTSANGTTTFQLLTLASPNQSTGGQIIYWDYSTGVVSTAAKSLYWGAANSSSTFAAFAS